MLATFKTFCSTGFSNGIQNHQLHQISRQHFANGYLHIASQRCQRCDNWIAGHIALCWPQNNITYPTFWAFLNSKCPARNTAVLEPLRMHRRHGEKKPDTWAMPQKQTVSTHAIPQPLVRILGYKRKINKGHPLTRSALHFTLRTWEANWSRGWTRGACRSQLRKQQQVCGHEHTADTELPPRNERLVLSG